jgi:type IV pilus assembly protein PilV
MRMTRRRAQAGATLIEILVTVVLLSFGVLSLAGLQAYSVAASKNAVNRGLAASLASDLADMIRANSAAFAAGNYNKAATFIATATAVPTVDLATFCSYPNCTTAQLAALDAALFNARLKATLRGGTYAVIQAGGSTSRADIYIMWQEQRAAGATAASESSFDSCPAAVAALDPLPRCYYVRVNL